MNQFHEIKQIMSSRLKSKLLSPQSLKYKPNILKNNSFRTITTSNTPKFSYQAMFLHSTKKKPKNNAKTTRDTTYSINNSCSMNSLNVNVSPANKQEKNAINSLTVRINKVEKSLKLFKSSLNHPISMNKSINFKTKSLKKIKRNNTSKNKIVKKKPAFEDLNKSLDALKTRCQILLTKYNKYVNVLKKNRSIY